MTNMKKRAVLGVTVPEVLVVALVLSLLMMTSLGVLAPALKVSRAAEQSTAAQREVVLALDRLVAEMSLMDRATVTTAPGSVSFLSSKPYTGTNTELADPSLDILGLASPYEVWQKFVVLRLRNGDLMRREYPYSKGGELARILPLQLEIVADQVGVAEKIFAKEIETFDAVEVGSSRIALQLRSVQRQANAPAACEVTLQIQMRGGT